MRRNPNPTLNRLRPHALGLPAVLAGLLIAGVAVGGCQKTPLRKDDRRSQFDRYDATRNERAPAHVQDAFGRRQPNLRGRLMGND